MKYSVIIPAYQAEKTLSRCLDSVLAGLPANAEILLVNDGSTDATEEICRAYAGQEPRVRWFSQPNRGVSAARNLGLTHARGEYVMFVDSDDYVSGDYFSVIDGLLTGEFDFLMSGKSVFDGSLTKEYPISHCPVCTPEQTARFLCEALIRQNVNAPFAKVFRRDRIEEFGLAFDERLPIGEDKVFVVQYLIHARNAVFAREALYTVSTENPESLSRRKREDLCDHILLEHQLLFEAAEASADPKRMLKAVSYSYYRSAYTVIRELQKFDYPKRERLAMTREICRRYAERKGCTFGDVRHWLIALPVRLRMAALIDHMLQWKCSK